MLFSPLPRRDYMAGVEVKATGLGNTFTSVSVQAALEHRSVAAKFKERLLLKIFLKVTVVSFHASQPPDLYCTCATFNRDKKEARYLTPYNFHLQLRKERCA